jgi:hypothetical protein
LHSTNIEELQNLRRIIHNSLLMYLDLKAGEKREYLPGEETVQRVTHAQTMARLQYPYPAI